jgi:hypothetical protein
VQELWAVRQPKPQKGGTPGYDGGKQIKGRKRHLLVDTQGLLLKVHEADIHDQERARWLLGR